MTGYRLLQPTVALFSEEGLRVARTLPMGAVIAIDHLLYRRDKFVEAVWEGQSILMFGRDIRTRARKLRKDWKGLALLNAETPAQKETPPDSP